MPCYRPITMYRSKAGKDQKTGRWPVVPDTKNGYYELQVPVACRQCIGCKQEYSRGWAVRCSHESQMHNLNTYLTLTYNNENLPAGGTLVKSDIIAI